MSEEAFPEAAALLRDAGWKPHDAWSVYTRGTIVMGFEPSGLAFHAKNWGLDVHGPDTPDDPVEAAAWLVARFPAPVAAEAEDVAPAQERLTDGTESIEELYELHKADVGTINAEGWSTKLNQTFDDIDADFSEPLSLGAEILDADEPDHGAGAFIFGDNLAEKRTVATGLVVQISLAKQDAIWANAGVSPDDFAQLTGLVVRDMVDGSYRGDAGTYERFVALSHYDNAARAIQATERAFVRFLTDATREEIEAFDPEAGWPA